MGAVWVTLFPAGGVVSSYRVQELQTEVARKLVTQILREEDKGAPNCKGVTVTTAAGTGFVKGKEFLSDGSERQIMVERRGESVEVQVLAGQEQ